MVDLVDDADNKLIIDSKSDSNKLLDQYIDQFKEEFLRNHKNRDIVISGDYMTIFFYHAIMFKIPPVFINTIIEGPDTSAL